MPGPRRRAMSHGNGVMLDVGMGSFQRHDPALESTVVRLWPRGLLWTRGPVEARGCKFGIIARMTRGKQKIEAQKRSAERNEKPKGSQIEARNAGLKTVCSVCKAPLANHKQLVDHFGSKHPKETVPPGPSS